MQCSCVAAIKRKTFLVLEPITVELAIAMNRKPEMDGTNWQTPKLDCMLHVERFVIRISKMQYHDVLYFLEACERFNVAVVYSKYRPNLNEYRGHYKEWWVYQCLFFFFRRNSNVQKFTKWRLQKDKPERLPYAFANWHPSSALCNVVLVVTSLSACLSVCPTSLTYEPAESKLWNFEL